MLKLYSFWKAFVVMLIFYWLRESAKALDQEE